MTDGPFRNLKLDSRSKRFAEAVQNDAVDHDTRRAYASDAIVHGVVDENGKLLLQLRQYGRNGQLELDPQASIASIFDACPKSEFGDHLERQISYRIQEGHSPQAAIQEGLNAAAEAFIGEFRSRTQEACLDAYRSHEMSKGQLDSFIKGSAEALDGLDRQRICDAIRDGEKSAFKHDVQRKDGLDEGPEL